MLNNNLDKHIKGRRIKMDFTTQIYLIAIIMITIFHASFGLIIKCATYPADPDNYSGHLGMVLIYLWFIFLIGVGVTFIGAKSIIVGIRKNSKVWFYMGLILILVFHIYLFIMGWIHIVTSPLAVAAIITLGFLIQKRVWCKGNIPIPDVQTKETAVEEHTEIAKPVHEENEE